MRIRGFTGLEITGGIVAHVAVSTAMYKALEPDPDEVHLATLVSLENGKAKTDRFVCCIHPDRTGSLL